MTKTSLAAEANVSTKRMSAFESGQAVPSDATLANLAQILRFPISFFSAVSLDLPMIESASFRALRSATLGQRSAAFGAGVLALELSKWLESKFNLPKPDVPDLRLHTPDAAACAVRAMWGIEKR
jgi:transcriptional regulator with XRE-family HTH domain